MRSSDGSALDDPVGESLRGRHANFARRNGNALAYESGVATFVAVPVQPSAQDWTDLADLLGAGGFVDLFSLPVTPPSTWAPVFTMAGLQLVGDALDRRVPCRDLVELGAADVPDMLELAARTRPGPFWPRTHEMGTYFGIRENGALIAMAGERLRPPGWTEISAVCTLPEARGRGLAATLVRSLAARIAARGERPFLHVAEDNTAAIALYERLGFRIRKQLTFRGFRTPSFSS